MFPNFAPASSFATPGSWDTCAPDRVSHRRVQHLHLLQQASYCCGQPCYRRTVVRANCRDTRHGVLTTPTGTLGTSGQHLVLCVVCCLRVSIPSRACDVSGGTWSPDAQPSILLTRPGLLTERTTANKRPFLPPMLYALPHLEANGSEHWAAQSWPPACWRGWSSAGLSNTKAVHYTAAAHPAACWSSEATRAIAALSESRRPRPFHLSMKNAGTVLFLYHAIVAAKAAFTVAALQLPKPHCPLCSSQSCPAAILVTALPQPHSSRSSSARCAVPLGPTEPGPGSLSSCVANAFGPCLVVVVLTWISEHPTRARCN